jgi:FkbM family methyltransferase
MSALLLGLRLYTKYVPFKRGRGFFIRPIETSKRRGWPAPLMPIENGLFMEFEPSLIGWTCFERGVWEPEQTTVISALVHSGAVVLDVGANTGYYALIGAALAGPTGHVHAFEIQAGIIDILRRNIARNGLEPRITVVPAGCFSIEGEATIDAAGDPGSARIAFGPAGVRVPLTTIDRYATANALSRVDLVIIDAEGADFEILKGAYEVLARFHPTVMAEVHHLASFRGSEQEMITFMATFGYAARALTGEFSRDLLFLPSISEAAGETTIDEQS